MAPIIISIILFFALVIAYYLYRYELEGSSRSRIASIALFFNSVAATITIIFLMFQTAQLSESVKIQTQTFSHEHRPYLFVSLNNHQLPIKGLPNITRDPYNKDTLHGGGLLFFFNEGKVPASIIKTQYILASDEMPEIDLVGYFESVGGFPDIRTVFPKQEGLSVFLNPSIGTKPRLLDIWASITYKGTTDEQIYWYTFRRLYCFQDYGIDSEGHLSPKAVQIIEAKDEWDQNNGSAVPVYTKRVWEKYLPLLDKRK